MREDSKAFLKGFPDIFWILLVLAIVLIAASVLREHAVFFQINSATAYFAALLQTITGWALVAVIIACLMLSSATVRRMIGRITKFDIKGVSFTLGEDSRRELEGQFDEVAATVNAYRERVAASIRREVGNRMLQEKLAVISKKLMAELPGTSYPDGYRCTVHMQDLVFNDRLYQLLNYHTADGDTDGSGRSLPIGYGIIGRVWRSGLDDLQGKLFSHRVTTGPDGQKLTDEQRIMLEWGMNRADAVKAKKHPSYLCCLIRHEEVPVGIFYADAEVEDAFVKAEGATDDDKAKDSRAKVTHLFKTVATAMDGCKFGEALHTLRGELAKVSPRIEIGS